MSERKQATKLRSVLARIDRLLDSYRPPVITPKRLVGDILRERAAQAGIFKRAEAVATKALEEFPLQPQLLLRRARAKRGIIEGHSFPQAKSAEDDLRLVLKVDPDNYEVALELIDLLFTHSGIEGSDAADVAGAMVEKAARSLRNFVSLQIRALAYAERHEEMERLYRKWSRVFPESGALRDAHGEAVSMRPAR
jgi:hypothetical protein